MTSPPDVAVIPLCQAHVVGRAGGRSAARRRRELGPQREQPEDVGAEGIDQRPAGRASNSCWGSRIQVEARPRAPDGRAGFTRSCARRWRPTTAPGCIATSARLGMPPDAEHETRGRVLEDLGRVVDRRPAGPAARRRSCASPGRGGTSGSPRGLVVKLERLRAVFIAWPAARPALIASQRSRSPRQAARTPAFPRFRHPLKPPAPAT